ncbi:unnamed protein product, partial [marine sediment metagenome]
EGGTMDPTEAQEGIEDAVKDARTRRLALLIAALAALLAIVSMQDDNTAQDAIISNIEASDLWSFFQAKTVRQFTIERESEALKVERVGAPPEKQAAIDDLLKAWAAKSAQYDSEKTGEGRKELMERAKAAEADRDLALAANNEFGYASAALQLAIVLASASISLGVGWLASARSGSAPWQWFLQGLDFSRRPCCRSRTSPHIR